MYCCYKVLKRVKDLKVQNSNKEHHLENWFDIIMGKVADPRYWEPKEIHNENKKGLKTRTRLVLSSM